MKINTTFGNCLSPYTKIINPTGCGLFCVPGDWELIYKQSIFGIKFWKQFMKRDYRPNFRFVAPFWQLLFMAIWRFSGFRDILMLQRTHPISFLLGFGVSPKCDWLNSKSYRDIAIYARCCTSYYIFIIVLYILYFYIVLLLRRWHNVTKLMYRVRIALFALNKPVVRNLDISYLLEAWWRFLWSIPDLI